MNNIRLPDFICIGTQKSGTTTLHEILKNHSQVYLPERKEASFFHKDEKFNKGVEDWIKTHFSTMADERIVGVFSPDYLYFPLTADRIKDVYGPNTPKIIIVLRDPANRAYSHYLMSVRKGFESLSFEEAIEAEPERLSRGDTASLDHFSYIDRGRYAEQISRYIQFIDRKDILFLSYEQDIRKNLEGTLQRIQQFLHLDIEPLSIDIKSNPAKGVYSKSIQQLIRKENPLKRVVKKAFGSKFRRKIKEKLIEINESKSIAYTKLEDSKRLEINNKYFSDEPHKLFELTGLDFHYWLNRIND